MGIVVAFIVLLAGVFMPGQAIPHCTAQRTDGSAFVLPEATFTQDTVLVVAYTRRAKEPTAAWSEALQSRLAHRARIVVIAALDQVPWFARSIVKRSIAREVGPPQTGKPVFVTTFEGRALRDLAPTTNDDIPLVISIKRGGTIISAKRMNYSDQAISEIEQSLPVDRAE